MVDGGVDQFVAFGAGVEPDFAGFFGGNGREELEADSRRDVEADEVDRARDGVEIGIGFEAFDGLFLGIDGIDGVAAFDVGAEGFVAIFAAITGGAQDCDGEFRHAIGESGLFRRDVVNNCKPEIL